MKMTLLELTQNILSAMDAEQVTSIEDTVESMQVAEEIRNTYFENFGNFELKSRLELTGLESNGLETDPFIYQYPHALKIPDAVDNIKWIKFDYNRDVNNPKWVDVCYITPEEYLEMVMQKEALEETDLQTWPSVLVKDPTNNKRYFIGGSDLPKFWTTFDDEYIVFDSIISDYVETAVEDDVTSILENGRLLPEHTLVYAEVIPIFELDDDTVPDLEDKFFPMLLAEAKSACFINYKGVSNSKEEQRSRRQLVRHQNNRGRYNPPENLGLNYGRS